METSSAEEQLG